MDNELEKRDTEALEKGHGRPAGVLGEDDWHFIRNLYHLTARELQVAILVCRSFDNKEISRVLNISPGTVKTHLRNIYRRVRVKSKISLLLKFIEDIKNSETASESVPPFIPISEKSPGLHPHVKIRTGEKMTKPA